MICTGADISIIASITALVISIIALIYTAKTFYLKSGAQIRGLFSITSSMYCEDKYVSNLVLENMKDRSTVIFTIYLLVGNNYYIELENFEGEPLILKPFEVYSKQFDPVDFYDVGMMRIRLNDLIDSKKVKSRLVVSTSIGRYKVKEWIERWDPIADFFKNHMTAIIKPIRSEYKGTCYGGNVKYIVEVKTESGKEETISIYPRDYELKKFKSFQLTRECLESKESLEKFLYEKVDGGILNCVDITVFDIETWRNTSYDNHVKKIIDAKYNGWFSYFVLGRVFTIISNKKLKIKNKKNRNLNKKKLNT